MEEFEQVASPSKIAPTTYLWLPPVGIVTEFTQLKLSEVVLLGVQGTGAVMLQSFNPAETVRGVPEH